MSGPLMDTEIPYTLTAAEKKTVDSVCRPETVVFSGRFMSPPKRAGKANQELIFIIGTYRAFFINAGGKMANEAHLYDLVEIDTSVHREVTFKFRSFSQTLLNTAKAPEIATHIQRFYLTNFPGMNNNNNNNNNNNSNNNEVEGCGGFAKTYRCLSDYLGAPVREDIVHDIEVFYSASNIRTLNLNDWPEPPSTLQSRALIASLKYNLWFSSVVARGPAVKVGNEGIVALTDILQTNKKIDTLELISVGSHEAWITNEIWMTFALNNYLTTVNLSSNPIEDKGCFAICTHWLSTVSHPIISLNLDKCDIGVKGTLLLFRTLRENKWVSKNIKSLCVSYNKIEDSASELVLFLREANNLQHLEMGHTNPTWATLKNTVVQAEKRLSNTPLPKALTQLNLAGNKIPRAEIFTDLAAFLQNVAPALTDLDLSGTSLPLATYPTRALFAAIPNLVRLELADNEFGEDGLHTLVDVLTGSDPQPLLKLKVLNVSRNIVYNPQSRTKLKGHGVKALEKLVSLQSNLLCPIDTLKFAASTNTRLKTEILPLVNALATNETITDLDITGHIAGDELAVALGRMLQVNHSLRSLLIDENLLSVMGLEFIALGLKRNFTLTHFPIPILDISEQLKMAENREGLQQLREKLRLPTDTTQSNLISRSSQVVAELQKYTSANNVRVFHENLKSKAAARRGEKSRAQEQSSS